ncbi:ergothioneine biosynthesis protein EgtC [bacterium]|nr:MAG: ergothioneine biosynthesis protein EgtC [bacterium]
MCRLVIYKGGALPISKIVLDPPHSLFKQSYEADEMLSGRLNADGFGFGWYHRTLDPSPAIYTNTQAIWHDVNVLRMMNKISSELIFAHVRGASEGMPVTSTNTHPFSYRNFLFMHNGAIDDFRTKVFPAIAPDIYAPLWDHIKGNTDSEHVFGLWLSFLSAENKATFTLNEQVAALRKTISHLEIIANKNKIDMVLNIGISDGINVIALRHHFGSRKATLYYIDDSAVFPGAKIIASEKLNDEKNWKTVPERSFVTIDSNNALEILPL